MPMQKMVNGELVDFTPEEEAARLIEIEQARLDKWPAKKAWAKEEASRRIAALAPQWKQLNMIARALELERNDRKKGLAPSEQAEIDAIDAVWAQVKDIRTRSNEIESAVDAIDPASPTADADLDAIIW